MLDTLNAQKKNCYVMPTKFFSKTFSILQILLLLQEIYNLNLFYWICVWTEIELHKITKG